MVDASSRRYEQIERGRGRESPKHISTHHLGASADVRFVCAPAAAGRADDGLIRAGNPCCIFGLGFWSREQNWRGREDGMIEDMMMCHDMIWAKTEEAVRGDCSRSGIVRTRTRR